MCRPSPMTGLALALLVFPVVPFAASGQTVLPLGEWVTGTLESSEADAFSDGGFVDRYRFHGATGERIEIALETAQLLVVAIKAPAAPDSATVRLVGETMVQPTGGWSLRETTEGLEIR